MQNANSLVQDLNSGCQVHFYNDNHFTTSIFFEHGPDPSTLIVPDSVLPIHKVKFTTHLYATQQYK